MESPPPSMSVDEQLAHWRDVADRLNKRNVELQKEYDEQIATSAMLERELETSLDQKERKIRDLNQQLQRMDKELDFTRKKGERFQIENGHLENEIKTLKNEKERHVSYIRELEQKNDDLERGQRVVSESVAGIETLLHQAYERNAVLESEVDEVENLRTKLQRATDEARDLKQELTVKDKLPNGNVSHSPAPRTDINRRALNGIDSNRLTETETQTSMIGSPLKLSDVTLNGNTMTPSSRISALNIVGDLLRKVGELLPDANCTSTEHLQLNSPAAKNGLESKLASCRAPIHNRDSSNGSSEFNRDPYRTRRISNRGSASPAITPNFIH